MNIFNKKNTFCISVKSNTARWARMQARFLFLGMRVTRWDASTPDTVTDNFYDNLSGYQKACAQSHINVWRHIVDSNLPYALIMEDDACFDKQWYSKLLEFNNTDCDLILLNSSEPTTPYRWTKASDQYLTGCYVISNKGAKTIFELFKHQYGSADWMTKCLQDCCNSYTYFPWLVVQEGLDTTISSNLDGDREKVVKCLCEISYSLDNYI